MNVKKLPSQETLKKLFRYEPDTGKLFWREQTPDMFEDGKYSAERKCKAWNSKYAGKEALTADDGQGYKKGIIFKVSYRAHRIIWKLVNDEEPPQIDHIGGNRSDNRLHMLRASDSLDNSRNRKVPSWNTSGVIGVRWYKRYKKWIARINVEKVDIHLGYFDDFDEAVAARKAAEKKYGFHKNHGRD